MSSRVRQRNVNNQFHKIEVIAALMIICSVHTGRKGSGISSRHSEEIKKEMIIKKDFSRLQGLVIKLRE